MTSQLQPSTNTVFLICLSESNPTLYKNSFTLLTETAADSKKPESPPADSKKPESPPADSKKPESPPADSKKPESPSADSKKPESPPVIPTIKDNPVEEPIRAADRPSRDIKKAASDDRNLSPYKVLSDVPSTTEKKVRLDLI